MWRGIAPRETNVYEQEQKYEGITYGTATWA
jgi:hypothetical protein